MAVVNTKSASITNRDAVPSVLNNSTIDRAQVRLSKSFAAIANGDSIASVIRMVEVASNARVDAVRLSCGAITSAAADVGVYRNTRDGAAVVDADFFGSAVSIATILTNSDVTNESTVNTIAKQNQPLWQALGFTTDPNTTFDICLTLTAAATAGGDVALSVTIAE
jgi:hypothetical protein